MDECKEASATFWEIAVASPSAKRSAVFTYSSDEKLTPGTIVTVPLKRATVFGVVLRDVKKPSYSVKPVASILQFKLPKEALRLLEWMLQFYPLEQGAVVRLFTPPAVPIKKQQTELQQTNSRYDATNTPLTKDQTDAIKTIHSTAGPLLLHGETGTGKTRVYEQLAHTTLASGKSVMILTPEISLSQHLYAGFSQHFDNVIVYHSLLTPASRRDIWYSLASNTQPRVIIGPRSALFLPVQNVGLIVMDEAHDASYKHQQSPHYSTLQVAATLANQLKIPMVYGSATPNVADYYAAEQKGMPIIRMTERPVATKTKADVTFHIISTRDKRLFTRSHIISNSVLDAIRDSSKRGMQSLLLLNRRGTAQLLRCEDCGWDVVCTVCSHSLVYHKDIHKAVCHVCDRRFDLPNACAECGGAIQMLIIGTKYVEDHLEKLFPDISICRIDSDSVERDKLDQTLQILQNGEALIIVGTQLLAKGIDLPLLENVVVLDAARQSSDYLSDERYYQLLHQVIGRGSRGHQKTNVFVQSNSTDDPIITWATSEKWHDFYKRELTDRETFRYPPFCYLASVHFEKSSSALAENVVIKFREKLRKAGVAIEVLGPLRDTRVFGRKPVWRVLFRSHSRQHLIQASELSPSDWHIDLEPINV